MRLTLAINTALLFGSYVIAIPVWPNEASGSGSGNTHFPPPNHPPPDHPPRFHPTFGYLPDSDHQLQPYQPPPAQRSDATRFPPPNHPPPDHPPRFHPTFGYLPDPAHQLQPYQPPPAQQPDATHHHPNRPPPGHPSPGHHNLDNLPGPPEGQPPLHQVLGDSRGGLFGLPYRCTGCGRQSPGPGPGVDHPVPSTPVNHNNPNPSIRTGQGGANRRTRTRHTNTSPYARPGRSDAGGSGAGGSNGGEPGPGVNHSVPSTPVNRNNRNPFTRTGRGGRGGQGSQGGADRRDPITRPRVTPYVRPDVSSASGSGGGAVGAPHASGSNAGPLPGIPCPMPNCPVRLTDKKTSRALRRHLGEKHNINPLRYTCDTCGKMYTRRPRLTRHWRNTGHS